MPIGPDADERGVFDFRGGSTLIFDMEGDEPSLRYAITRPIGDRERLEAIQAHKKRRKQQAFSLRDTYFTSQSIAESEEPFCFLHGGD